MVLTVFCHSANSSAVLTVKGKYMKSSVVIRYYRHAHSVSSAFSAFFLLKQRKSLPSWKAYWYGCMDSNKQQYVEV